MIYQPQKKLVPLQFPLIFTEINIDGKAIQVVPGKNYTDMHLAKRTKSIIIKFAGLYFERLMKLNMNIS